jgi:hypothetical protein
LVLLKELLGAGTGVVTGTILNPENMLPGFLCLAQDVTHKLLIAPTVEATLDALRKQAPA